LTSGENGGEPRANDTNGRAAELSTPEVLRLLAGGATGAILMALGEGPLRTKELTERVQGHAPRTVYRYAGKLASIGIVEREEEPGVPSKVVHRLADPSGTDLYRLIDAYASASRSRLPNGEIGAHAWGSLALLADLWASGLVEELNRGPRTATELARMPHGLSYHQVSRRISLLAIGGFVSELPDTGRRRRYVLTEKARRAMSLIAGIGRWRRRHVVLRGEAGLSAVEGAELLRTALPLASLPEHTGKRFSISVLEGGRQSGESGELVSGGVEKDGSVVNVAAGDGVIDGLGSGPVVAWVDLLLDGPSRDGVRVEGDRALIKACMESVHEALWRKQEEG
jgi:DNA-binding HxlR family transcriptional regulator